MVDLTLYTAGSHPRAQFLVCSSAYGGDPNQQVGTPITITGGQ